jgi:integrase
MERKKMVITMKIKHVIKRGKIYYFRMPVPKDCIKTIGKTEIILTLKTGDPLTAKTEAEKLEALWTGNFEKVRNSKPQKPAARVITPLHVPATSFRQKIIDLMEKNLPEILEQETEEELKERFAFYADAIQIIGKNSQVGLDLPEIGICWPLKHSKSPRQDRQCRRDLIEVLGMLRKAVSDEFVQFPPKHAPARKNPATEPARQVVKSYPEEHDIMEVAELMLAAKKRITKTKETVKTDIRLLKEWAGRKNDITAYSKKDLIDFIQNCLPYLPANISRRGNKYRGKTLRQCVEMTKTDPDQYPPISHTTCGNRLVNIIMVFNYAKDQLGIIPINPAMGIEIPKVLVSRNLPRGFIASELTAMWAALQTVREDVDRKPSHYWTTVLSLYHGFRLNEVCSLFLKDVYEDEDGVFVININDVGQFKSVKNQSSIRIVPVHPFVRDQLGFKSFVESQKNARSEGVLFLDVKGNELKGYRDRMSKWFADWKKEWLPSETQYKHFHDLRYTFIQTAQNVAKMPDRHAQEITGHSIEGVSAVHLGYSGRLKPVDLLPELTKVQYGWE